MAAVLVVGCGTTAGNVIEEGTPKPDAPAPAAEQRQDNAASSAPQNPPSKSAEQVEWSNETPTADRAPLIESVTPQTATKGEWVSVAGQRLKIVQCSAPQPGGPDAATWLVPAGGGDPITPFAFNDPRFSDGDRANGEWTNEEIYFQVGEQPPGRYKLTIKTNCAFSNEVDFEIAAS